MPVVTFTCSAESATYALAPNEVRLAYASRRRGDATCRAMPCALAIYDITLALDNYHTWTGQLLLYLDWSILIILGLVNIDCTWTGQLLLYLDWSILIIIGLVNIDYNWAGQ